MRLSSFRRLIETDYPEDYQDLIEQLGIPLNSSFEELYDALNNKLSFRDNLNTTISSFNVVVDSDGKPKNKTSFKLNTNQTVIEGLIVINALGVTDPTLLPTAGIFISFVKSETSIIVQNIKGLQADKNYNIKVVAI